VVHPHKASSMDDLQVCSVHRGGSLTKKGSLSWVENMRCSR